MPRSSTLKSQAPQILSKPESIVVLGAGASRETQSISRTTISQYVAGTSPFKALSKLPGVMFSTSDPLGNKEASQVLIIRGFDQSRLGYTMDGVPLGDLRYGNDNGLSINRALQNENNGRASLSQGAGSVDVAAANNLGGALQFTSIDPTDKFGVDVEGMGGSSSTWRSFMRINSGLLPKKGKFYVSYDYADSQKWKGQGHEIQQQANAKFVQPLGDHVTLTLFGDWSLRRENNYLDLSLSAIKAHGYNSLDNINNNYGLAKQIASAYHNNQHHIPTPFPAGVDTTNSGDAQDFTYWNGGALRQDELGYGRFDFHFNDRLKGYATIYGHMDNGEGIWATPYSSTPADLGGSPLSLRTTEYNIHREGFLWSLNYLISNHSIEGGFWFENNDFNNARRYYPLPQENPPGYLHWYKNNWYWTQWQTHYNSKTYQFHLQDTWRPTKKLKINYGFKSLIVDETAQQQGQDNLGVISDDGYPSGSMRAANGFLPQLGVNYRINNHNEVFADFARNMSEFGLADTFQTSDAAFSSMKNSLKPEMSYTEELGYRFHDDVIQASITGYYVEFENRLLSVVPGSSIQGKAGVLSNVGSVTTRGVDMALNYNFAPNWSLYASYSFNDSHYNDDVQSGSQLYHVKGKDVVGMPRNMANVQLGYDDGSIWGNINMQFQDRRTYTYTNDSWVPSNEVFNLNVGYRFHSNNVVLRGLEGQVNVTNLFNKRYAASITGYQMTDPSHTYSNLEVGAPRMVFFTLRKHF